MIIFLWLWTAFLYTDPIYYRDFLKCVWFGMYVVPWLIFVENYFLYGTFFISNRREILSRYSMFYKSLSTEYSTLNTYMCILLFYSLAININYSTFISLPWYNKKQFINLILCIVCFELL